MSKINNGAEKKQLDFNNLMKAVSGLNPNKMKHLTEEDLQEQLSLSKESEKKEDEVKDSSVHDATEGKSAPTEGQLSLSKETEKKGEAVKDSSVHDATEGKSAPTEGQLSSSKETQDVQSPFSYENIIRKSNIEDGQFTTFKLKRETLDMLDAIARGSEKNVSKSTIIHNLVSTFLNENIERLKMVASKKIKKDYLK